MAKDAVCAACGALITNTELAMEGMIRVIGKTGRMQLHPRCFEWSEKRMVRDP